MGWNEAQRNPSNLPRCWDFIPAYELEPKLHGHFLDLLTAVAAQFKNGWSYIHFSETVRGSYRYVHPSKVKDFLETLLETANSRIKEVPAGLSLWRAQLGHDTVSREVAGSGDPEIVTEDMVPFSKERMKPLPNAAHEGRVNPKGIPCLYLADDEKTAISEVRPWVGAVVTSASFRTKRNLRLIDFTLGHDYQLTPEHLFGPLSDDEMTKGVWTQVDKAFSEPVTDDPSTAEYVPTQIIAERFRCAGYDGLIYVSRLGKGFNYALFDIDSAEVKRRILRKVSGVTYDIHDVE